MRVGTCSARGFGTCFVFGFCSVCGTFSTVWTLSIKGREDEGDKSMVKLSVMRSLSVGRRASLSSAQNLLLSPVRPRISSCDEDSFRFLKERSLGNAKRSSRRGEGGRMGAEEGGPREE
jgi:hypothetical protein